MVTVTSREPANAWCARTAPSYGVAGSCVACTMSTGGTPRPVTFGTAMFGRGHIAHGLAKVAQASSGYCRPCRADSFSQ